VGCLAYELACGSPPFVSDNSFELAGMHDRDAVSPPSERGSLLGPPGDALILGLLAKATSERQVRIDAVLRALAELGAANRPIKGQADGTAAIIGEQSLIRYTTDEMLSVLSFEFDRPTTIIASPENAEGLMNTATEVGAHAPAEAIDGLPEVGAHAPAEAIDGLPASIGRYAIISLLGTGGLGRVYLARGGWLDRDVAIKLTPGGSQLSPEDRTRLRREALAVARLSHPNIVAIYDVNETDEYTYTVLEYVEGGDLRQRMGGAPWPPVAAAQLVLTLALAVEHAHSLGIVHRDLKPSNILLTAEGKPKISDFGLAKLIGEQQEAATVTFEGTVMGTPSYMAPEQTMGAIQDIGPATDIYALGTILYELLAGRRPFQGGTVQEMFVQVQVRRPDPPSRWVHGIPDELDLICLRCLEKSPGDRYATADELAGALERFIANLAVARAPSFWENARALLGFKKRDRKKERPAS
jgi:serine/threonine protein kinase